MLEYPTLLLLPWTLRPGRPPGRQRVIADAASGQALGFAQRRPTGLPAGLRWLRRSALDIFETEDESLLFTLSYPWLVLRGWKVADADEHPVGSLRGHYLLDRYDRLLATVERAEAKGYLFRSVEGHELGWLIHRGADNALAFAEPLAGDPFARMMLLAAALALT
jgi:hypothetical protein